MTTEPRLWDESERDRADILLEFAGVLGDDPADHELVRRTLHDRMLASLRTEHRTQLGPVEWRYYDADAAPDMLRDAKLADDPHADGLVEFLREPGAALIVASVACTRRPH